MILIVGATGQLGGKVLTSLRANGQRVRALVRSQSDGSDLRRAGAEIVEGDLRDQASLARACKGVEKVLSTANSARRSGDDTVRPWTLMARRR